jgi:hypothetical protein
MSTRSRIAIEKQDGTVDSIYCHFDGYLEHNGKVLNEHYTDEASIWGLIALGDLSILGPEIGEQQDFNGPRNKQWCLAYGRDRGETGVEARKCSYVDYTKEHFEEYVYLFTPGKGWEVRSYGASYWADLSKALQSQEI